MALENMRYYLQGDPMTKLQLNKERRQYANELANRVAKILGLPFVPKCARITRCRGRAHYWDRRFSVPAWIFDKHLAYRNYYIAHEVCHFVRGIAGKHGPYFHRNEQRIAHQFGYSLIHQHEGRGPYLDKIVELDTLLPVCDRWGRCVVI